MVHMLAIRAAQRSPAQKTSRDRDRRFNQRHAKRDDWQRDSDNRGRLLRSSERQRAQHEAQKQASRIAQKNRRRVEVEAQESKRRTGEDEREQGDVKVAADQGEGEDRERRKETRPCRQPIKPINQIEGVGNPKHPDDRQRQR